VQDKIKPEMLDKMLGTDVTEDPTDAANPTAVDPSRACLLDAPAPTKKG
jgi:hypothetical protein